MSLDQSKSILLLIPEYGHGGAQRVFSQLANSLAKDHRVTKVVFNNDYEEVYPASGKNISLDVRAGKNLFMKGVRFLQRCWKLYQIKSRLSPAYTISHLEGANFVNILSFGKGKKILCVHGSKTANDISRKGIIKLIENKLFIPRLHNLANMIVPVSNGIANELIKYFNISPGKIHVIQNGIDTDSINDLANEELSVNETQLFDNKAIVFAGRLALEKNLLRLLEVYSNLPYRTKIKLLLIGDGPEKANLINCCEKLELIYQDGLHDNFNKNANVFFLGFYDNPFKIIRQATVSVFTSEYEGFPLSHCESIACGTPVIATDCPAGGTREVMAPETIDFINPTSVAQAVSCGVLMPLLNSEVSKELWVQELSEKVFDVNWPESLDPQLKQRSSELSIKNYNKKWHDLLAGF